MSFLNTIYRDLKQWGAFHILQQVNVIDAITADNLQKTVGFSNTAVHNIINKHMSDFSKFAKQIYSYIDQSGG